MHPAFLHSENNILSAVFAEGETISNAEVWRLAAVLASPHSLAVRRTQKSEGVLGEPPTLPRISVAIPHASSGGEGKLARSFPSPIFLKSSEPREGSGEGSSARPRAALPNAPKRRVVAARRASSRGMRGVGGATPTIEGFSPHILHQRLQLKVHSNST